MRAKPESKRVVTFRPCPRCGGAGRVPCDGNEHIRAEQRLWAYSYAMKPVTFQIYDGTVVAGLAVPELQPGGYHYLKVYVKVTDVPTPYGYACKIDSEGRAEGIVKVGSKSLFSFDIIEGKAFWPVMCRYQDRDKLTLLDYWPENLSIDDIKLLEIPN